MFKLPGIDLTQVGGGAVVLYVTYLLLKEVVPMVRQLTGNGNGKQGVLAAAAAATLLDERRAMFIDVVSTLVMPILAGQTKILDELRQGQARQTEILLLLQQAIELKGDKSNA